MSEELKPCPNPNIICESISVDLDTWHDEDEDVCFLCQCRECDYRGPICNTEAEAIAAWNTRPIEDELRARVKELENQVFNLSAGTRSSRDAARIKELEEMYKVLIGLHNDLEEELEARCENDEKSIHYLHEELEALKQWQREAVKYLPFVKDEFETAMNERKALIGIIKKSAQEDQKYSDYAADFTIVANLIKRAEEN